ncbi:MAG: diguanylate cyclase domain-containing protein [Candidatus Eiseniibacteriota bacterium]
MSRNAGRTAGSRGVRRREKPGLRTHGDGRAAARRHLELLSGALGWTSVEREKNEALLDAAHAEGESARAAFREKLLGWSRAALEAHPEPIESARLSLLQGLASAVRTNPSTGELLQHALELVRRAVSYESATFFLYDRRKDALVPAATSGTHVDLIPDVRFDLGTGLSSWVARSQRPVLLAELRGEAREEAAPARPGSFLSVPLVVQKELVGVLNIGHTQSAAFTEADRDLLCTAGGILASALVRQIALEDMRLKAVTDELTGLSNRAHFESRVAEEIENARRYEYAFSVVLFDLDRFRAVNQAYGKPFGDACLLEIAKLLRAHARQGDLIARLAPGDEFAILLSHQAADAAQVAAHRLKQLVDAHLFPRRRRLSVSAGVATFPQDGIERGALLAHADLALAAAKSGGRLDPVAPAPDELPSG